MTKTTNGKILLGCVYANPKNKDPSTRGGVWSVNGIAPTLTTFKGGGSYPMIVREVIKRKATNENPDE